MRVPIIRTKHIPNQYGGFEQVAEYLLRKKKFGIIKIHNVYSCENIVNTYAAHFEEIVFRRENKGVLILALDAGQISLMLENS
jgi:hypothetical protein